MDLVAALRRMQRDYIYTRDSKSGLRRNVWSVLPLDEGAPKKGDCEDCSLTVIALVFDGMWGLIKALVTGKAKIHHVDANGGGAHAVGSIGELWFDNWIIEPREIPAMPLHRAEFFARTGHTYKKTYSWPTCLFMLMGPWKYAFVAVLALAFALAISRSAGGF